MMSEPGINPYRTSSLSAVRFDGIPRGSLPALCRWTFPLTCAVLIAWGILVMCGFGETVAWNAPGWDTPKTWAVALQRTSFAGVVSLGVIGSGLLLGRRWIGLPVALAFAANGVLYFSSWVMFLRSDLGANVGETPAHIAAAAFVQLFLLAFYILALHQFMQWHDSGNRVEN